MVMSYAKQKSQRITLFEKLMVSSHEICREYYLNLTKKEIQEWSSPYSCHVWKTLSGCFLPVMPSCGLYNSCRNHFHMPSRLPSSTCIPDIPQIPAPGLYTRQFHRVFFHCSSNSQQAICSASP